MLAFAIAATLLSVPFAFAETPKPVLWLGELTEATEGKFNKRGGSIEAIDCAPDDVACVAAAIDDASARGPRVLVAPPAFTGTVIELYDKELTKEKVQGVVLLGPQVEQLSVPKVSAESSALLVLVEETQDSKEILAASLLSRAFATQGAFARLRFVNEGMLKLDAIRTGTVLGIMHFTGGDFASSDPNVRLLELLFDAEFTWPALPPNNRKLRAQKEFVSTRPMRGAVKRMLRRFFHYKPHMIHQWPRETYDSLDLLAYRDGISPGARFAILRNRVGMIFVLDLDIYGAYRPEIVVGIDDETNMYRIHWFYRTNLKYSWLDEKPNVSARPLGPFLSFRKSPPRNLVPPAYPKMALHLDGIAFSNENPFAGISDYPDAVQRVITKDNQCIYCHEIEGAGGRAHHLDAMTAQPQGGYALPLADYSEEVMREFVFDQEALSAKFGVTPNAIDEKLVDAFFAWARKLPRGDSTPEAGSQSKTGMQSE